MLLFLGSIYSTLNGMINNKIHLFYNGKETLEFQESQECTQKKYLILPDLNMPVMNG